ncbi:MAG: glycerate kinase [Bacteroidales bacterium]|nr:glycerate kinase [Candidatus Sodaliphilus aphodohippi]
MKAVIAIDSFKGCLTAREACEAAARGVLDECPGCDVALLPVADGGEGVARVLTDALGGQMVTCSVCGPVGRPVDACYGLLPDGTAIIEMAQSSGLPLVPVDERNPENTTTRGLGELIIDALDRGCRNFLVGLGGSATNDVGTGMLQALGVRFGIDGDSSGYMTGGLMEQVISIDTAGMHPALVESRFTCLCDVNNPLCGERGAAAVYGPQKGADEAMVQRLDSGARRFAALTGNDGTCPGDGAAGGLGYALRCFLKATLRPGIDVVLDALHCDEHVSRSSLVITGEGASDRQTVMGKAAAGVLAIGSRHHVPVCLMAGHIEDADQLLEAGFAALYNINDGSDLPLEQLLAPAVATVHVTATARIIARRFLAK